MPVHALAAQEQTPERARLLAPAGVGATPVARASPALPAWPGLSCMVRSVLTPRLQASRLQVSRLHARVLGGAGGTHRATMSDEIGGRDALDVRRSAVTLEHPGYVLQRRDRGRLDEHRHHPGRER